MIHSYVFKNRSTMDKKTAVLQINVLEMLKYSEIF